VHALTASLSPLRDLNKEVFNSSSSLEDRLKKGKHYRQKGSTENHAFL
jgi:hypothetical protein